MIAKLDQYREEDLALLVDLGMIAIKQGDEDSAKKIFKAIGIIKPNSVATSTGFGLIAMNKMEMKEAKKCFNEVLTQEPDNHRIQSFIAFCSMLEAFQGKVSSEEKMKCLKECITISEKILDTPEAADDAKQVAQSIINFNVELQEKGKKS